MEHNQENHIQNIRRMRGPIVWKIPHGQQAVHYIPHVQGSRSVPVVEVNMPSSEYQMYQPNRGASLRPECSICLKTFSRAGSLKVHMRVHTGEKPFQCRFCPKAFAQSGNFTAHERIHTGEKPYQCEPCGKRFTQASAYKNHMFTHYKSHHHQMVTSTRDMEAVQEGSPSLWIEPFLLDFSNQTRFL